MRRTIELPRGTTVTLDNGIDLSVEGNVVVDFNMVDHGIGAYEYWGATGVDVNWGPEDLEIAELDLGTVETPDGNDWELTAARTKALILALDKKLDTDDKFQDALYGAAADAADEDPDA